MWRRAREVLAGALSDFSRSWTSLTAADIGYKGFAFAVLTPATALLLRWLLSRAGTRVVADADIARFFVTTRSGAAALLVGGAFIVAILAIEVACLMTIGLAAAGGARVGPRAAAAFTFARVPSILLLSARMVIRALAGLVPFLAAGVLGYLLLLRQHDINYYLAERPPAFWAAAALAAMLASLLAALLAWTITRWSLALPLVVFEGVGPVRALGASAARSAGNRPVVALVLAVWAAVAVALMALTRVLIEVVGRTVAPHLSGSLAVLLAFIAGLAALGAALTLAVLVVSISLFALILARLYLHLGDPREPRTPVAAESPGREATSRRSWRVASAFAAVAILAALGITLLALLVTRGERPVQVIAHRGSSAAAPENTLAAFRLAVQERADFVELDVQESLDGEVMVIHDSDLMKVGGSPMKIWENTAAQLRTVDIGSRVGAQFSGERVPTLAEVLAACKGSVRVIIELKSYGHDQRLEERVAALVEAAGMENDCVYMSLDHEMARKMKSLRPGWRVGVLAAKALGNLTTLNADFLAVETRMASVRFIGRAHRAAQDVYVWTVNDPASLLSAMSKGVDGLITDTPAVARDTVEQRAQMSDAERILVALLVHLGARTQTLEADGALRP